MKVGDPDGHGRFGVVEETHEGLVCHECGAAYTHLGLHAYRAHGLSADQYRERHGLGRRGLVASGTRTTIADNARRLLQDKPRFVARRDPAKATQARLEQAAQISAMGLEAIRAQGRSRKGATRLGTVVVCQECGAEFCPLTAARKRRFCTRSCASRANRREPTPPVL